MTKKDYIPKNDVEFVSWGENLLEYATEHYERWGVIAPGSGMLARFQDLKIKTEKCLQPTRSKVDTLEKNESRKVVEKDFRSYVQGYLAKNPLVTNADREMMGLRIYDTIPTPVGDPVGLVKATVKYVSEGALELHIEHVAGTPFDKRANYGVKIRYVIVPFDAPPVTDVVEMPESRFTRRKKELFTFLKKDAKKSVFFCLRYENSKGGTGQWGPIFSAVIP